jgi:hypothetical protein
MTATDTYAVTVTAPTGPDVCHLICCRVPAIDGVPQVALCGTVASRLAAPDDADCVTCARLAASDRCPHTGKRCPT